ncbi:hypothetical protein COLO4_21373 [Corchorus olitorius]|uniref:Uncharacterized protein n=1 Tax=Corchorus olitorius TaxID=93759 RepID=A0A1R3ITJ9_9ROSI|nr:hypothetical protein COLO4_21373 [Corchorus olitorius]
MSGPHSRHVVTTHLVILSGVHSAEAFENLGGDGGRMGGD